MSEFVAGGPIRAGKFLSIGGDGAAREARRAELAPFSLRPCYHVWERIYGSDLRHPDGIRWRCAFCPAVAVKRPATLLDQLIALGRHEPAARDLSAAINVELAQDAPNLRTP